MYSLQGPLFLLAAGIGFWCLCWWGFISHRPTDRAYLAALVGGCTVILFATAIITHDPQAAIGLAWGGMTVYETLLIVLRNMQIGKELAAHATQTVNDQVAANVARVLRQNAEARARDPLFGTTPEERIRHQRDGDY